MKDELREEFLWLKRRIGRINKKWDNLFPSEDIMPNNWHDIIEKHIEEDEEFIEEFDDE